MRLFKLKSGLLEFFMLLLNFAEMMKVTIVMITIANITVDHLSNNKRIVHTA